jgi:hypothetical protein
MTTQSANHEITMETEDVRHLASMAAALRAVAIANQLPLTEQGLTVTRSGQPSVSLDFAGKVPFGFIFTTGFEAAFEVPCGYRFWIEHISLSLPSEHDALDVQLATLSPHMIQQVKLRYGCDPNADGDAPKPKTGASAPIMVPSSTTSTLLFSNGMEYGSSIVPPGSYVQLWGYLEPTEAPTTH